MSHLFHSRARHQDHGVRAVTTWNFGTFKANTQHQTRSLQPQLETMVRRTLTFVLLGYVTAQTTYHGRVALAETEQYDHAAARNSKKNTAHNTNTHFKAQRGDYNNVKVLSAVAYDFKDNTVADVDCVTGDWGDWNHCKRLTP